MTSVYFCERSLLRARQRETIEHCPPSFTVIRPTDVTATVDTRIPEVHRSVVGRLRNAVRGGVPLNARWVHDAKAARADLLYCWGAIPVYPRRDYVVELDNPYVLSLYSLRWFRAIKPALRSLLASPRCRRIVCISEACKRSLRAELGDAIASKAKVVYPYIEDRTSWRPAVDKTLNFLFVSSEFQLKGGREVLRSFERLVVDYPAAHLFMVTNAPADILDRYRGANWVTIVRPDMRKVELHERFFKKSHVFVMPTYYDSFGLVFLEALSFGLPIIAAPTYALPEMVLDGENGYMIPLPPFRLFQADGKADPKYWSRAEVIRRIALAPLAEVEESLLACMKRLLRHESREAMAEASRALFRRKFANHVRSQTFEAALEPS